MVCKKQLNNGLAGFADSRCVGVNNHSVRYWINAGGTKGACSLYLNYANTAGAFFTQLRMVAELRNADPGQRGGFDYCVIVRY